MKPWSRLDWLILLLFAALVILFYWRILTPNPADRQSFPPGDFHAQFWAFTTFEVRELSAGRLPLWNPYAFAGSPFWADVQAAVFYPPSLLTLLLSASWGFSLFALEVEAIAHFWLAAVFMVLFMRQVTESRPAAVIAALTFTFSGYLTGYPSQQLAVLEADIWLPLILFFLHRASQPRKTADRRPQTADQLTTTNTQQSTTPPPPPAPLLPRSPAASLPRLFASSPLRFLLLTSVAWGMTLLAGHPQSALIVAYISVAYLFFLSLTTNDQRPTTDDRRPMTDDRQSTHHASVRSLSLGRFSAQPPLGTLYAPRSTLYALRSTLHALRSTLHALLFLLTGLALAAIQFIPAVEYTLLSVRAAGTYDKMSGGFPITDVIQFLLPGQVSHYSPLYIGIIGLILALWVVFAVPNRQTIFWALVAFIALLISLGGNTFLYTPLYLITPGFAIFRGQERWAFAVAFSLSVLAGYGFKALLCQVSSSKVAGSKVAEETHISYPISHIPHPISRTSAKPPLRTLHAPRSTLHASVRSLPLGRFTPHALTQYLFLFALLLTFIFFLGLNTTGWTPASPFYGLLGAATLLTILLALAWLLWRFADRLHPAIFTALTAALICFDLYSVNWQTNLYPQPPEWHTQMSAAVAAIKKDATESPDESFRVYNEFRLYDNYGIPFEIEDLWGASPLRPARYDQFLAPPMPIERTWELLNVKYVITWRKELYVPSIIIYEEPAGTDTTYVHRLNEVGPRAWLVNQIEIADDATILQKIADPNFDRWHIALLEPSESANQRISELTNDQLANGEASSFTPHASRLTPHASHLTLHVTTPSPALLILSEIDYPGWQATVDGQSASILRADYILRAVPIPAGEHTVELIFRPLSFVIGAIVSTMTLIAIVITLILAYRTSH